MRYSKLFGKTVRQPKREMKFPSHKLLYQAGFVRELSAGRYEFLPLGMRVHKKMIDLIDKEMESLGSQRVSIPVLQPIEFWKKTNRDQAFGNLLMKLKDRNEAEFALSATGEGILSEMVAETQPTYKDLPIVLHQFIIKLRDEIRPRGGLLRVREFVMKDAYSFHATEKSFMKTYQKFYDAYSNLCEKLDLKYYPVIADSGALGGDYCHEFQVPCEVGEDKIVKCDGCDYAANVEMSQFNRSWVNKDQKPKKKKTVDLPTGVATIPQCVEHYGLPAENFLKNVVYKTKKGKLVIVTVTGNLEVNELKLAKVVNQGELEKAEEKDLKKIGTKTGFVHSWGYEEYKDKIIFVADIALKKTKNLYGGFKTETTDPMNVCYGRDFKADIEGDIAEPFDGAKCARCNGKLKLIRAVEFGHIFKYDHFYSKHHDGYFNDKDGKKKLLYTGAYGIGIGRAMAVVVEKHHDEKGIIWPEVVAPYLVHLISLERVGKKAETLYKKMVEAGVEVLWDDREESAGVKFKDADLIGIPYRLVVSRKTKDQVEYKRRNKDKTEMLSIEEVLQRFSGK